MLNVRRLMLSEVELSRENKVSFYKLGLNFIYNKNNLRKR